MASWLPFPEIITGWQTISDKITVGVVAAYLNAGIVWQHALRRRHDTADSAITLISDPQCTRPFPR